MEGGEGGEGEVDGDGSGVMIGEEEWFVKKQGEGNKEMCVCLCAHVER